MSFAATDQRDDQQVDEMAPDRRHHKRPVAAAAFGLIVLSLVIRAWWSADAWFVEDDFTWITGSRGHALDWGLMGQDVAGHLLPGCWALSWLITAIAPFERWPAVVVTVLLLALCAGLFWRLLRRLFGERPATLVPLVLYLSWAMSTTATIWWSAVVLWLPFQVALLCALLSHLRFLQTGRWRDAVLTAGSFAVGLFFFEKAMIIPVVLFAFTAMYGHSGRWGRRLGRTVGHHWRSWVLQASVGVAYLGLYVSTVPQVARGGASARDVLELARNLVVVAFGTEAVGGPWTWGPALTNASLAAPPRTAVWIAAEVCLAVILLSRFTGLRSSRAWVLLGGYLLVDVALLATARLSFIGPAIGLTDRYLSDVALVAALAVGLAFLPLTGAGAPPQATSPAPSTGPLRWLADRPIAAQVGAVLLVNVVALSSWISASALAANWKEPASQRYVAALRADLRAEDGPVDMFDATVPPGVVSPVIAPTNRLTVLAAALPEGARFPAWTRSFHMPDETGHLRPGVVSGFTSRPGPRKGCGWLAQQDGVDVPLTRAAWDWPWVVRVGYLASADTRATVTLGGKTVAVELERGLNDIYVAVTGAGDRVYLGGLADGVSVCVGDVVVGTPVPKPTP
ncbi:MAG: hypothetical protein JWN54_1743 [Mycobacterium sp.]|nr:hypothetical protein [Mycobacterium sp.]